MPPNRGGIFSLYLIIKHNNNNFRSIIEPKRNNTVAYSPADDHGGVVFREKTCIILREETLVGGHQAADEGQTKLAAMGMTAEYQIDSGLNIDIKEFRPVSQ